MQNTRQISRDIDIADQQSRVYVICGKGTYTGVLSLLLTWWEAMSKDILTF